MNASPPDDDGAPPVAVGCVVPSSIRVGVLGTFLILFVGALYYARGLVLPLVMACLLTLTLSPLVRRLARSGMPAALSAILLVGVVGSGIGAASILLSGPLSQMAAQVPDTVATVRERLAFLKGPISALNTIGKDIESTMGGSDAGAALAPTVVLSDGGGFVRWLLGTLADFGTTLGATLLLAVFLLAAMDGLRRKLVSVLPALSGKKRSLRVLQEIENDVSRYLATVMAINAGLGFMVGGAMALLGLGNAIVWGVVAALLNFVPYAGPATGICLVAATSLASFDSLAAAAAPPLVYLAIQVIEGSFVTPMILGRRLSLSPIAILTMLSLTTWMWGIVGTLIGVPLLVVLKVLCDQFPSLAGLGVFLSGETATVDEGDERHSVPFSLPPRNHAQGSGVESIERQGS